MWYSITDPNGDRFVINLTHCTGVESEEKEGDEGFVITFQMLPDTCYTETFTDKNTRDRVFTHLRNRLEAQP